MDKTKGYELKVVLEKLRPVLLDSSQHPSPGIGSAPLTIAV